MEDQDRDRDDNKENTSDAKENAAAEEIAQPETAPFKVRRFLKFLREFPDHTLHVGFVVPGTQLVRVLPAETIQIDRAKKAVIILCMPDAPARAKEPPRSRLILPPGFHRDAGHLE